jgi:hypothetical protein
LQRHIEDPTEQISGYVEMLSTTVLGVAICSCDFAVTVRDTGWDPRGHDRRDRHTRRERLSIQRPLQPPSEVAQSGGVVGNVSRNCDRIRCGPRAVGRIFISAEYFACDLSNLFILLFIVSRFATPRIAQQKVLLFGIV